MTKLSPSDFEGNGCISLGWATDDVWKPDKIEFVFKHALRMEPIVLNRRRSNLLQDKIMAAVFYQPSTRTRNSFTSAMTRLGGGVIGWENAESSRAGKATGESDADIARMLGKYADAIAVRHYREGAARTMQEYSGIPVFNGGDGHGSTSEHPTQALGDLLTIKRERGRIGGLRICYVGTRHKTRAVHSEFAAYSQYDAIDKMYVWCPPEGKFDDYENKRLKELGIEYEYVDSLEEVITDVNMIHVAGHFGMEYRITADSLKNARDDLMVFHCLPRVEEISTDVDELHYAKYWEEAHNCVIIRMALLALAFGREL